MTTTAVVSANCGERVRVALQTFTECESLPFDLHVAHGEEGKLRLLCKQGYPLSQGDLDRLAARGVDSLYISTADMGAYQQLLGAPAAGDDSLSPGERLTLVLEAVSGMRHESISRGDVPAILAATC